MTITYGQCVKDAFRHTYGHGGWTDVPAGAGTKSASAHGGGFRWVDPSTFPRGSMDRWDAEYYGIRVPINNLTPGDTA